MDGELIGWIVLLGGALIFLIYALSRPKDDVVSRETIARIENGGRHL